jgi:hypothetical protein
MGIIGCNKDKCRATICPNTLVSDDDYYPNNLCTDSLCEKYQNIWKEIIIEKNGLTEHYFNNHIKIMNTSIIYDDWNDDTLFTIGYTVMIDWAVTYNKDWFIIKTNERNKLSLPCCIFLTKEDIKKAVDANFQSNIITLTTNETLNFNSFDNAMAYLIKQAQVSTLCYRNISIDRFTGHIFLESVAEYVIGKNKCIKAQLDLMNKEVTCRDFPCMIIN